MASVALYNGQAVAHPIIENRGLAYGDGLFETIACIDGELRHWDAHISRLGSGCETLKISAPNFSALQRETLSLLGDRERAIAKIIITRGAGGRGYTPTVTAQSDRLVQLFDWPRQLDVWRSTGISIGICETILASNAQLAGLKHLNRLEQVLAAGECQQFGWDEGLMRTASGNVICGTKTNLFLVKNGVLVTPGVSKCGVAGTMRSKVISAADALNVTFAERDVTIESLLDADNLFVTNAVIGLAHVNQLTCDFKQKTLINDYGPCSLVSELRDHLGI